LEAILSEESLQALIERRSTRGAIYRAFFNFLVGAAVKRLRGSLYGVNVESASMINSLRERVAVWKVCRR